MPFLTENKNNSNFSNFLENKTKLVPEFGNIIEQEPENDKNNSESWEINEIQNKDELNLDNCIDPFIYYEVYCSIDVWSKICYRKMKWVFASI